MTEKELSRIDLTADIVGAYVSNNSITQTEMIALIGAVHAALRSVGTATEVKPEPLVPAVPIKKSLTAEWVICLEDGKKFKSMKRHLSSAYGMTPAEYRSKWGLPADYPMTAPAYAEKRSKLALSLGLGRKPPEPVKPPAPPARRGRKPKQATT